MQKTWRWIISTRPSKKKEKKCQDVEKISGTVKVMRRRRKRTIKNMASTHNIFNTRKCGVCTSRAFSFLLSTSLSLSRSFCLYIFRYFLHIHISIWCTHTYNSLSKPKSKKANLENRNNTAIKQHQQQQKKASTDNSNNELTSIFEPLQKSTKLIFNQFLATDSIVIWTYNVIIMPRCARIVRCTKYYRAAKQKKANDDSKYSIEKLSFALSLSLSFSFYLQCEQWKNGNSMTEIDEMNFEKS